MKVFISWSGETSRKVAIVLREWLPSVIQSLEPYVSSEDIDKGARWSTDISSELDQSSYGILCVTRENLEAPWLNFEAGALSKSVDKSRVSPFLFEVRRSEIQGPILQFQSTTFEKDDVKKLVHGLNKAEDSNSLEETRVDQVFDVWWPKLEEALSRVETATPSEEKPSKGNRSRQPSSEILEELLELLRQQHRLLNSPEELVPRRYFVSIIERYLELIPDHHPVYSDLERTWRELESIISTFEAEDDIPVSVVKELYAKLERPIGYILRRPYGRARRLRRLSDS